MASTSRNKRIEKTKQSSKTPLVSKSEPLRTAKVDIGLRFDPSLRKASSTASSATGIVPDNRGSKGNLPMTLLPDTPSPDARPSKTGGQSTSTSQPGPLDPSSESPQEQVTRSSDVPQHADTPSSDVPSVGCIICALAIIITPFLDCTHDGKIKIGQTFPCALHGVSDKLPDAVVDIVIRICKLLQDTKHARVQQDSSHQNPASTAGRSTASAAHSLFRISSDALERPGRETNEEERIKAILSIGWTTAFDLGSALVHYGTAKSALDSAVTALRAIESVKESVLLMDAGLDQLVGLAAEVSSLADEVKSSVGRRMAGWEGDGQGAVDGAVNGKGKKKRRDKGKEKAV